MPRSTLPRRSRKLKDDFVILNAEVAAAGRNDMPLGHDVLQSFILTLNGKAETFDLVDP